MPGILDATSVGHFLADATGITDATGIIDEITPRYIEKVAAVSLS